MKFPEVEIEKRDRAEPTDTLIKSLLDEEKASKKQKRGDIRDVAGTSSSAPTARKGKTLAEIEAEEGGPVKESMVGMAHTKRALDRKKRDVDVGDTEVVTNTERYEKDTLEVEEEDGIKFEPFNLKQEREEGFFDEDGNYVLRKADEEGEGGEGKDAWLDSEEAKVVSEEVRRRIEEQRARAEEAARRGPLTERQIAQRKAEMAGLMQPGESVTRALKRLGGAAGAAAAAAGAAAMPHRAMGKRERARLLAQQAAAAAAAAAPPTAAASDGGAEEAAAVAAARERFTRLTELADELLTEGELEVYGNTTEELLRSARMWLPQLATAPPAAAAGPAAAPAASGQARQVVAADSDDDMFADDKENGDATAGSAAAAAASAGRSAAVDEDQDMFADDDKDGGDGGGGGGAGGGGAPPQSTGSEAAAAVAAAGASGRAPGDGVAGEGAAGESGAAGPRRQQDEVDYSSWPVKELKRLLQERGVDPSGFVEKQDMVAKVREVVAAAGVAGAGGASASGGGGGNGGGGDAAAFTAPPGYAFDPSSGYFYSEEAGMYYDTNTGGYCQVSTGKWFYVDPASGSFVEWKQG